MARFIELNGTQINLDHVRELRTHWHKDADQRGVDVVYADGTGPQVKGGIAYRAVSELRDVLAPVVPALPGFALLRFWFYDAEPINQTHHEPIIAWRITDYGPEPVVIDTDSPGAGGGAEAFLRPDGMVFAPGEQTYPNIDAWAEDVFAYWSKWCEKKKAEAA